MYLQKVLPQNHDSFTYQIVHFHFGMYYNPISPHNLYQNTYHLSFCSLVCTCNIFLTKLSSHIHTKLHIFNLVCIFSTRPSKRSAKIHTKLHIYILVCIYRRFIPQNTTLLHTKLDFYILVCVFHIIPIKNDKFWKKNQKKFCEYS